MFTKSFIVVLVTLIVHIVLLHNGVDVLSSLTGGQTFTESVGSFVDTNDLNFVEDAFDKVGNL